MLICDVIQDLRLGDTGKAKITHALAQKSEYNVIARINGSQNCGHTLYHENKKYITHMIPVGVFHDKASVIGPQCMLNTKAFFDEANALEEQGINVYSNIKIDYRVHIITDKHLEIDSTEIRVGSTRRGVGPCATDKFARIGKRAEDDPLLQDFLIDSIEYFHTGDKTILTEGAQGYYLSIDSKNYPYVTSADVTVGSVVASGIPPQAIRNVYGIIKAYDTYVGSKKFQPDDDIFKDLAIRGNEYGSTTGRLRQCNWLCWDETIYAARASGVTHLIINKVDILEQLNKICIIKDGTVKQLDDINHFKAWVIDNTPANIKVTFSDSPYKI